MALFTVINILIIIYIIYIILHYFLSLHICILHCTDYIYYINTIFIVIKLTKIVPFLHLLLVEMNFLNHSYFHREISLHFQHM